MQKTYGKMYAKQWWKMSALFILSYSTPQLGKTLEGLCTIVHEDYVH